MLTARNAMEIGKAAEHLVCADLLLQGVQAFLADQGMPFDVIAPVGEKLLRIQVKSTLQPKNVNSIKRHPCKGYQFHARYRGKNRKGIRLSELHCDLMAFVALDIRAVAYFPVNQCGQTVTLMPPDHTFRPNYRRVREGCITEFPFFEAVAIQCLI